MAEAGSVYPPLEHRPLKGTICLFDVDGTLTPARKVSRISLCRSASSQSGRLSALLRPLLTEAQFPEWADRLSRYARTSFSIAA